MMQSPPPVRVPLVRVCSVREKGTLLSHRPPFARQLHSNRAVPCRAVPDHTLHVPCKSTACAWKTGTPTASSAIFAGFVGLWRLRCCGRRSLGELNCVVHVVVCLLSPFLNCGMWLLFAGLKVL